MSIPSGWTQKLTAPSTRRWLAFAATSAFLLISSGCVTRTVYVREGNPAPAAQPRVTERPAQAPYSDTYVDPPQVDLGIAQNDEFYDALNAYGRWHHHGRFGYVFVPSVHVVGNGFRPYTQGHWEYTEWGWTWVSHLPFGWATGHYGRWFYDSRLGWAWVPGTTWAPAWVTWRTGGAYVGWAPLPPGAMFGGRYDIYNTSWVCVTSTNFGSNNMYGVLVRGSAWQQCYNATRRHRTTINIYGRPYYRGPDPVRIRDRGGRVTRRPIRETDRDRATTRPPSGVVVGRRGRRDGGDHDHASGGRRNNNTGNGATTRDRPGRDGRDAGRDNGRDDGRAGRDNGRDRGRDNGRTNNNSGDDGRTRRNPPAAGRDNGGQGGPERGRYPEAGSGSQGGPERGRYPEAGSGSQGGPERGRYPEAGSGSQGGPERGRYPEAGSGSQGGPERGRYPEAPSGSQGGPERGRYPEAGSGSQGGPERGRYPEAGSGSQGGPERGRYPEAGSGGQGGPDRSRHDNDRGGVRANDREADKPDTGLQRPYDDRPGMNVPRRTGRPDLTPGHRTPTPRSRTTPSRQQFKNNQGANTHRVAPPPSSPSRSRSTPSRTAPPSKRKAPSRTAPPAKRTPSRSAPTKRSAPTPKKSTSKAKKKTTTKTKSDAKRTKRSRSR